MARNSTAWSEGEDKILLLYYKDAPKEQILKLLPNRSWQGVKMRAQVLKVNRPKKLPAGFRGRKRKKSAVLAYLAARGIKKIPEAPVKVKEPKPRKPRKPTKLELLLQRKEEYERTGKVS